MDREKLEPLALGNEGIRHPFRQSLPIEMVQITRKEHALEASTTSKERWLGEDASLFLLSFLAFFTAFYTFIF
tara:strand:+ start:690 stop:908 length:219 start_codon:yes stop_codon:yes gene_type:complete